MPGATLRVVVADDDIPTAGLVKDLLESFEGVTVAGIASNGKSLLELVAQTKPDIVFVDVQMPDLDGLTAASRLQREYPGVFIIFISAYPHYAAEAFNLDAVDYVVKPLSKDRIGRALAKGRRFLQFRPALGSSVSLPYAGAGLIGEGGGQQKKLLVKSGHGAVVIDTQNILFVEKVGKKCIIHTYDNCYETPENLSLIEKKLDRNRFFRCHKSFIINVDRVEKVLPYADRAYEVTFYNCAHKVTMRREAF
ncbi:MAG: LytTR family DNA-binding domain-containing protein, partial [Firmicutes bacterium]|nr:LytTR family DNA-binding domain-containing protein [Bacillota bacterium]